MIETELSLGSIRLVAIPANEPCVWFALALMSVVCLGGLANAALLLMAGEAGFATLPEDWEDGFL